MKHSKDNPKKALSLPSSSPLSGDHHKDTERAAERTCGEMSPALERALSQHEDSAVTEFASHLAYPAETVKCDRTWSARSWTSRLSVHRLFRWSWRDARGTMCSSRKILWSLLLLSVLEVGLGVASIVLGAVGISAVRGEHKPQQGDASPVWSGLCVSSPEK
ncbi:hypothetical protein WMY93_019543 [Mugilogobius chulae]|uniref:Transmembrane protein 196 n=1 Tax=Mugilogobius chulae TaxID=88201 RepID=A0AAW0NPS3_9GOBI